MVQPHVALSLHRFALGGVALLATRRAGRLYGLDFEKFTVGAELTRLMAARNIALGIGLLASDTQSRPLLAKVNVLSDAIDLATITDETRRGAIPRRATVIGYLTAATSAALGAVVARRA